VVFQQLDAMGEPMGGERTPSLTNTDQPSWREFCSMHTVEEVGCSLLVSLCHAKSLGQDTLIGTATLPVECLSTKQDTVVLVELVPNLMLHKEGPCFITLRKAPPAPSERTVFLIRHGESRWNAAQREWNARAMAHRDHPLTQVGILQAYQLNTQFKEALTKSDHSDELEDVVLEFLSAQTIASSPLTRALQTALIGLDSHPALQEGRMQLCSDLREVKGPGGIDTVGRAVGDEIPARAMAMLQEEEELEPSAECRAGLASMQAAGLGARDLGARLGKFDVQECDAPWWTPMNSRDSAVEVEARLDKLVRMVKHSRPGPVILVGHSLLFKSFQQRFAPEGGTLDSRNPELAHDMRTFKLDNAACIALKMHFDASDSEMPELAEILEATLLFGSGFEKKLESPPPGPVEEDRQDEPQRKPGALPEGWEAKRTGEGKVFYVHHETKTTQWNSPVLTQPQEEVSGT